jgi:uncharacterized protein YigA (DUF484 family)
LLTSEQVADYLRRNPGFFEQNADLLVNLQIPHPHGGRAVSIGERQLVAARDKARLLEDKLRELIRFGEENDQLGEKVHRLACRLLGAADLRAVLDTARLELVDTFAVPHVAFRLWGLPDAQDAPPDAGDVGAEMREFAEKLAAPYCGHHAVYENQAWFGDAGPRLKSFALTPLRCEGRCVGVLALASEDPQRFYPEMGTLYLSRIGELIGHGLGRGVAGDREPAA